MGSDKALLEIEGQPLLLRAARLLEHFVDSVTLLGPPDRYGEFGLPVLADQAAGGGPLVAILTALEESQCEWNIFLACDLPWLDHRFMRLLCGRVKSGNGDAVVARSSDGWQPLCAAYRKTCLTKIGSSVSRRRAGVVDVLPRLRVDVITTVEMEASGISEAVFQNVNDPEDWKRALGRSRTRS